MAWRLEGTYFESCNCDMLCACTWSALTAKATHDRCLVTLAFHVDSGEIDGTDVSGLSFALVTDAPQVMSEGGWRVGLLLDDAADEEQADKLTAVASGQLGGAPAVLTPLIGEFLGVQKLPFQFSEKDGRHSVQIGDGVDLEVSDFHAGPITEPVQLRNVFHPSNTTLTISPADRARVDVFGIAYGKAGQSGFNAPFAWAG
jgi:hypothetical protein